MVWGAGPPCRPGRPANFFFGGAPPGAPRPDPYGARGPSKISKMDTFRFRLKRWGDLGYKSKFNGTHQAVPHSHLTWKRDVGSTKSRSHGKARFQ